MKLHVHVIYMYMYMYMYVQFRKKNLELAPKEKKETKKNDIFNFSTHIGADTHNHCHIGILLKIMTVALL